MLPHPTHPGSGDKRPLPILDAAKFLSLHHTDVSYTRGLAAKGANPESDAVSKAGK